MTDLKSAVQSAVATAVNKTEVDAAQSSIAPIAKEVMKEVQPRIDFANNQEPWYQSYVTLGAITTLIGGSYGLIMDFADGTPPTLDSFTAQAGTLVGAAIALYGRWVASKPLGN